MNRVLKMSKEDVIGIISSSLCIVHCLAMPLLMASGIALLSNELFTYLFLFISFLSIYKATKKCTQQKNVALFWCSFLGFFVSILLHHTYHWFEYVSHFFAILIIVAHIINIKNCNNYSKK